MARPRRSLSSRRTRCARSSLPQRVRDRRCVPRRAPLAVGARISERRRKLHGCNGTYRRRIERRSDVLHRAARRPPPALPRDAQRPDGRCWNGEAKRDEQRVEERAPHTAGRRAPGLCATRSGRGVRRAFSLHSEKSQRILTVERSVACVNSRNDGRCCEAVFDGAHREVRRTPCPLRAAQRPGACLPAVCGARSSTLCSSRFPLLFQHFAFGALRISWAAARVGAAPRLCVQRRSPHWGRARQRGWGPPRCSMQNVAASLDSPGIRSVSAVQFSAPS